MGSILIGERRPVPRNLDECLFLLIVAIPLVALVSVVLMYGRGRARGWKAHALAGLLSFIGLGWLFMWWWYVYVEGVP
jgi:hypothetical protein